MNDAQKNYESFALTSNGGLHYVDGSLSLSANSAGALSVSSSSTFFTIDSSIAQSPSTGTQSLIAGTAALSSALKLPTLTNGRQIVNGAVYVGAVPAQARVSYVGPNVQEDYLAADGSTVIRTLLGTSYTVVSLSGLISATPSELFTNSALLGNGIDAGKFLSLLLHDG
ncbi:hypothetical protein F6X37_18930 [Paraburkholderia sp. 31.1]|uniref:hypothetical protein n=1 Tax=Paraburkholderia sp. 31.1 TaxID=2615205 RepID=UPI00165588DA|nr:hypothetical protein [Paraburkholderia sp. 31.1]MBC8723579.1 hypothetical protein [Paraburkholderia sp. 31.1]